MGGQQEELSVKLCIAEDAEVKPFYRFLSLRPLCWIVR